MSALRIHAAFAAASLICCATAAQANDSDTTVVTATVPLVCDITAPASATLDLDAAESAIGNLVVRCNDPNGTGVSVASANAGALVGPNGSRIGYGLRFPAVGRPLPLATPITVTTAAGQLFDQSWPLKLVPTGKDEGPRYGGTYSDTITFEIVGN